MPIRGVYPHQFAGGRVATLEKTGVVAATGASTVEGTDKLTYAVESTGLYRVTANVHMTTAGVGAVQSVAPQVAYNNGTALAAANILPFVGAVPTNYDLVAAVGAAGSAHTRTQVVYAVGGTNIVMTLLGSGTFTTPAVMIVHFIVEAI